MAKKQSRRRFKSLIGRLLEPAQWGGTTWGPPGYPIDSGVDFSSYLKIYRYSDAVRSVVTFRAENAADLPLKVYRKIDPTIREAIEDHGLALTLNDPNPEQTQFTFLRDLFIDKDLFDTSYWQKIRVGGKLLLRRMYPDAMKVQGNSSFPDGWMELQKDGTWKEHKRGDVFWLRGYGNGISPLEALKEELEVDAQERAHRKTLAKTGWRNAGVIQRPKSAGKWTAQGRERFLEQINARYTGSGDMVGKPLLLEEDMHWTSDQISADSTDYTAARFFTIKKACLVYHMSPQIMGIEGSPYASQMEYKRQLFQIVLAPLLNETQQEVEKQLLPEFPDTEKIYVEFNLDAKLRGDPLSQAEMARTAVGGPYITPNEWRGWILNRPPVEGGDQLWGPKGGGTNSKDQQTRDIAGPERSPRPSDSLLSESAEDVLLKKVEELFSMKSVDVAEENPPPIEEQFYQEFKEQWDNIFYRHKMEGNLQKKDLAGTYQLQAMKVSEYYGGLILEKLGKNYDPASTVNYWSKISNKYADKMYADINAGMNPIGSKILAQTILTSAKAWGELEALRQHNLKANKIWRISEEASRHKRMDGEKRELEEKFSNGLLYPGQPNGADYEIWGCKCTIEIEGIENE